MKSKKKRKSKGKFSKYYSNYVIYGKNNGKPKKIKKEERILSNLEEEEPTQEALVGFKTKPDQWDAGIIYAPYIPMTITSSPIVAKTKQLNATWSIDLHGEKEDGKVIDIF